MEVPKTLYRYRSIQSAKRIIQEATMFCSSPSDFDDHDDCFAYIDANESLDTMLAYAKRMSETQTSTGRTLSREAYESLIHYIIKNHEIPKAKEILKSAREIFENSGVICFAKSPLQAQMWSFYGDRNKGVCLGFSTLYPSWLHHAQKVRYIGKNTFKPIPLSMMNQKAVANIITTKEYGWNFEKEWRFFLAEQNLPASRIISFDPSWLTQVIFGRLTSPEDIELIKGLLAGRYPHVVFSRINQARFGHLVTEILN